MKYKVIDNSGNIVRCFFSYKEASNYKSMNNRPDWAIRN